MAESTLLRRVVSGHVTRGLYRLLHLPKHTTGAPINTSTTTTTTTTTTTCISSSCSSNDNIYSNIRAVNLRCSNINNNNNSNASKDSRYSSSSSNDRDSDNNNNSFGDNHIASLTTRTATSSLTVATNTTTGCTSASSSSLTTPNLSSALLFSSSSSSTSFSVSSSSSSSSTSSSLLFSPSSSSSPSLLYSSSSTSQSPPPSSSSLSHSSTTSSSSSSSPASTSTTPVSKPWVGRALTISEQCTGFDLATRRSCCPVMVTATLRRPARLTSTLINRSVRSLITNGSTTTTTTTTTLKARSPPTTGKNSSAAPYSLKQLPGPKGWPFLGIFPELLRKENRGCIHKVQLKFHEKYGRMFRLNFGPHINVGLADPDLVEEFMRNEGKHPNRPPYQSWVLYKELRKKETGLMTAADHKWYKYRSAIAPRLMRPQAVSCYTDQLNTVALDLLTRIRQIRKEDNTVDLLQNELYKWATESVGYVLFGSRLGCLADTMPQNIQDLIDAVGVMFVTGHQMAIGASIHQFLNTKIWQKHVSSSDIIYGLAQEFIDRRLVEYSKNSSQVDSPPNGTALLNYLLSNPSFSMAEICSNMAELFLAGLDTASNSLGFAIYLLASNPKVQEKLHDEISRTLKGQPCQSSHLTNMPYLKAVLKESMRLYPVIPIGARITTEDIVLDGYHIPKGTCLMINNYAMSRDERNFPNANEFIPERWFRSDTRKFHPFAVIPFGHGSRSCIGRRIAELELYLVITHLCQNFQLKVEDGFEVEPFLRTVLTVGKNFPIQFIER